MSPRLLTWVDHHGNTDCVGNLETRRLVKHNMWGFFYVWTAEKIG